MTDLMKGIIEIDGYEINAKTTTEDVENNLKGSYSKYVFVPSEGRKYFVFKHKNILDKNFIVSLVFVDKKLSFIEFTFSHKFNITDNDSKTYVDWIKKILGEPTQDKNSYVIYDYPDVSVGAIDYGYFIMDDADGFIKIEYKG